MKNGSIKTATQLLEYQDKKFIEHLTDAINSCYTEPMDWDDFVNSINDSKYFIFTDNEVFVTTTHLCHFSKSNHI